MKSSSSNSPLSFTYQNESISNLEIIANIFSNHFCTIGEKTQGRIKHSHKRYTDYLTYENSDSFFLSPTKKEEIKFILPSLDINRSTGPYSFPSNVLNMLKTDIFEQLPDLLNLSFTAGTSPYLFKNCQSYPYP